MPEACRIRPMRTTDLPLVLDWRNHPRIRQHMLTRHEISWPEHLAWFEAASQDPSRHLCLVETEAGPIGQVQFKRGTLPEVADWGFYVRPDAAPGTGTLLGRCALDHAFGALGLHKVCGQALESNLASRRFHLKLGFTQEAPLRQHHGADGAGQRLICFGLRAGQWQAAAQEKPSL